MYPYDLPLTSVLGVLRLTTVVSPTMPELESLTVMLDEEKLFGWMRVDRKVTLSTSPVAMRSVVLKDSVGADLAATRMLVVDESVKMLGPGGATVQTV